MAFQKKREKQIVKSIILHPVLNYDSEQCTKDVLEI